MKLNLLIILLFGFVMTGISFAQVPPEVDTIYVEGGTFGGFENAGALETTINEDVSGGVRINPNRVYAIYQGQVYYQIAPMDVTNIEGTLTIVGVPDPANPSALEKPIILVAETGGNPVVINGGGTNQVYGSLKLVNIHYQAMQLGGTLNNELFYLGTGGTPKKKQTLTVDKCLFEFGNIDLFDCTDESGAIGGWPHGASFFITNSYFRNLFYNGQWWDSRVLQCKHPIDTLWIENNTMATGGLTFLQQNQLSDFVFINHNTIVNNKKYWLLSPYRHEMYITNNIFVNQNWVGEDVNVTNSGQDPDKLFMSTINIDTNNTTNGLIVQEQYYVGGDSSQISSELNFENMKIFVSNNINYYSPLLISGYYNNSTYILDSVGTIPSYLTWSTPAGPKPINNIPGMWLNDRTANLFDQYSVANGGKFVIENTIEDDPQTVTPVTLDVTTVTAMAEWNQKRWGDWRYANVSDGVLNGTNYIYGDALPTTLPGLINGVKTDAITGEGSGIQVGITKFTDLTENFSQNAHTSFDGYSIGSLIWTDVPYDAAASLQAVKDRYALLLLDVENITSGIPESYNLSQNYPNPFNPTTNIEFSLPKNENVTLKIFNVLGQVVATLVNGNLGAGTYKVDFDASKLSSGLYIYQIEAGSFNGSRKMMLLK